jgi:hypothetical protein
VGSDKFPALMLLFIFLAVSQVFSAPLEDLAPAYFQRLRSDGEIIIETQLRNPQPVLLPANGELRRVVSGIVNSLDPNIMIESLYLYMKPARFHTIPGSWDSGQRTAVFNQILALSTLTGIQYYSVSRGEMRTFYEFSGVIDNQRNRNPLPDPVFTQPQDVSILVRQRDLTFGDNIYRYDYSVAGNIVFFTQENVSALSYGVIPLIGRGNLRSVMAVINCGDSLLIYSVSMARAPSIPGLNDRIRDSFSNRAEAVLRWFTGRLDSEIFIR